MSAPSAHPAAGAACVAEPTGTGGAAPRREQRGAPKAAPDEPGHIEKRA